MHTMTLIKEHEGTEEWMCYSCGRQLLVSWTPTFEKIVLLKGDPTTKHIGVKNRSQIDQALLSGDADVSANDVRLLPWIRWMDQVGFEKLWKRGVP
jgi:hypothetical protein